MICGLPERMDKTVGEVPAWIAPVIDRIESAV